MQDGKTFVDIDAGLEVAPGDASDIEVANAHPWGSDFLLDVQNTDLSEWFNAFKHLMSFVRFECKNACWWG